MDSSELLQLKSADQGVRQKRRKLGMQDLHADLPAVRAAAFQPLIPAATGPSSVAFAQAPPVIVLDEPPEVHHVSQVPSPLGALPYLVLHLYSGQRREGDLQACLEPFLAQLQLPVVVLSLDVAIDAVKGDLSRQSSRQFWLALIRQRRVLAVVAGPPCETWSAVRAVALPDSTASPRPLRSAEHLWGLAGLTAIEQKQVEVGNMLLRFTIACMYTALAVGTTVLMEHPAPRQRVRTKSSEVSSWHLPELRHLMDCPHVCFHIVHQCMLGSQSLKPTGLLGINTPQLSELVDQHPSRFHCAGGHPHVRLQGRAADGSWRTSPAKQYPPQLCRLLATVVARAVSTSLQTLGVPVVSTDAVLEPEIAHFYVPLDPYLLTSWHGDFAAAAAGQVVDGL